MTFRSTDSHTDSTAGTHSRSGGEGVVTRVVRRASDRYVAALPSDTAWLSHVRQLTRAHLRLRSVPPGVVADAVLIVDELFTNAVQHGGSGPEDRAIFSLVLGPGALRIAVTDGSACMPRPRMPGPCDEGGRGLLLVGMLAADWGVDRLACGKRTWAALALSPCPSARGQAQTAARPR